MALGNVAVELLECVAEDADVVRRGEQALEQDDDEAEEDVELAEGE